MVGQNLQPESESSLDRLAATSPGLEVWWDSSPLVYPNWANKLLAGVDEAARPALAAHLKRWFDPQHPERTLFRGVTTNPPLSLQAMQNDPPRWQAWIEDYCRQYPEADTGQVYWALYKEIVRLGAEAFRPLFERTGYLYGYISAQVDPRRFFEPELMLAQALDLAPLAPNVMIKIPGTREGIGVIKGLTARGIPTNLTSGYTVPQFVAVAEAVQAGLLEARSRGVDLSRWRSVVTFMSVRWESAPEFEAQAQELGIPLSPDDRRLAGVAIFKQAYRVFSQRAYPSKMLICSVRMGPTVDGVLRCWHLEETAGASAVFTLPPVFLAEMFTTGAHLNYEPRIREDIPAGVLERLLKIPYFRKAYEPDGYTPDEFNSLPSLLSTYKEFSGATEKMVQFVAERLPSRQTISAAA